MIPMPRTQTGWTYLTRKPGSVNLQLYVLGRVAARTLFGQHVSAEDPRSIEAIAADYELPVAAVVEAIEYCSSDPPEIRIDAQREEAIVAAAAPADASSANYAHSTLSPKQWAQILERTP